MKILIVVNNLRVANGVATVMMNQYDALIEARFEVDFLQFLDFESPYLEKIKKNKGKITTIEKGKQCIRNIWTFLKANKYDIIHVNQMNFQTIILIIFAKIMKTKKVIYHSHNTKIPGGIKRNILEKLSNIAYTIFADEFIACTYEAGKDSFGKKKFAILKNSIDIKKFEFNKKIRDRIRTEINVKHDDFVVGTVCRIANQKNPLFVLDIVAEMVKINPKVKFLWVGSATSENEPIISEIEEKSNMLGIKDNMIWVGSKTDAHNWYSAMDVFLMPSKWEGLGITYLEAQANSLPTFASDIVPKDTNITDLIEYLSLDMSAKTWAKTICKHSIRNNYQPKDNLENFIRAGYDNESAKHDLLNLYNEYMVKSNNN